MKLILLLGFIVGSARSRFVNPVPEILTDQEGSVNPVPEIVTDREVPHVCNYNGTEYKEGDFLPTRQLCLNCKCTDKFVEPSNFYCDVIDCPPTGLETSCKPVYDPAECCPVDWDCKDEPHPCECDSRYFKHYEFKGCTPVYKEGCKCPVKFDCPQDNQEEPKNVCKVKDTVYQIGDTVPMANPCLMCTCGLGFDDPADADIRCTSIECPSAFGVRPEPGCYEVYTEDKCCSVDTVCPEKNITTSENTSVKTCEYGGETFYVGQQIFPKEDSCKQCLCTEDWTGIDGDSCKIIECSFETNMRYIQNCIPIYHEETCCPIEFYCGSAEEGFKNETLPMANNEDIESGNYCTFKGMHYKYGQTLKINHPTNCVTCTCTTPPDFTCVHKKCPGPPNDDYVNCIPSYNPDECCATYTCPSLTGLARSPDVPLCSPVLCPEGCTEVTVQDSCPFCLCDNLLCSQPQCPEGCHVQQDVSPGTCPGCDCPVDVIVDKPQCAPVKCQPQCHLAVSPQGCPMCICGPLCAPPNCGETCQVQRDVPDGQCPGCICGLPVGHIGLQVQCSPVQCPSNCHESVGQFGCPTCKCGPICSVPNCGPGCEIEQNPRGPCPACVCGEDKVPVEIQCSPVKCGPLCHEAYGPDGCPTCLCDRMCSPPLCDEGCHLDYKPSEGPCPTCVCKKSQDDFSDKKWCSPVKCDPQCHQETDKDGCPTCVCDFDVLRQSAVQCTPVNCGPFCKQVRGDKGCPTCECSQMCTVPNCTPHCFVDYNPSIGPCPFCVCDSRANLGIQCSPVKCDVGCRPTSHFTGDHGCPSCDCGPECSMPNCGPGCEIDYSTPCPRCKCSQQPNPNFGIQCSPVLCPVGCKQVPGDHGCPSCDCGPECSMPNCGPGCEVDYSTSCPSCKCTQPNPNFGIQCSPVICPVGCKQVPGDHGCPSCDCGPECSMPNCGPGCEIDYSTSCPSCKCMQPNPNFGIQCSPVICPLGCKQVPGDHGCPSCDCGPECSMPNCDPGCEIDYTTSCPSCKCPKPNSNVGIQCSMPNCDPLCEIDYSTPCPSCNCMKRICTYSKEGIVNCSRAECPADCEIVRDEHGYPTCKCGNIMCSLPRCEPGCNLDLTTKPCPRCKCTPPPDAQCDPVDCGQFCREVMGNNNCPSCVCGPLCSIPKCDQPGCKINLNAKPCPSCECDQKIPAIHCSAVKCESHCREVQGQDGCPTCFCKPECSMPNCIPGCDIDYSSSPCPTCVCHPQPLIQYSSGIPYPGIGRPYQFYHHTDPYCAMLKCGPGCRLDPSYNRTENDRCPLCVCEGKIGERLACAPTHCELPCRFERFSQYACPTCICHPIPCPPLKCPDGSIEIKLPYERCPRCVDGSTTGSSTM